MKLFVAGLTLLLATSLQAQSEGRSDRDSVSRYLSIDYSHTEFQGSLSPWRLASVSLGASKRSGSIIGRLNYANRFDQTGIQVEVDAYPQLGVGKYAYLNAGYSAASIFPELRFGGELFTNLPSAWEASGGFRHLRFSSSNVTLYTGSLGKYSGDYWISARPYVRFKDNGTSASIGVTGRRYFADAEHHVGARIGFGSSPSDDITPDQIARTRSVSANIHGSGGSWRSMIGKWSIGYDDETLESGLARRSWTGTLGAKFLF